MRLLGRERRSSRVVDWLNARLSLIFGLIMLMFLVSNGVSFYAFSVQRHLDDQKVSLREDVDTILQTMNDQQTGLRGYISGNNAAFLSVFQQARPAYLSGVDDLNTQLHSGPFQHTVVRLTAVQELADEWYNGYALVQINAMQAGNVAGPRSAASILQGNILFDQFRASVGQLQDAIDQDLAGYQNQVNIITLSLGLGSVALFLAAIAALLWLLRSFTARLYTQFLHLTATTQRLGHGERTARVEPLTFSDLDEIGQSINRMAAGIQHHEDAAEEAMRVLAQQYVLVERAQSESRAIFDASNEAYLFISADGEVHAINRLFSEFFALSSEEVVGQPFARLQQQWEPLFMNAAALHGDLELDNANQSRHLQATVVQNEPLHRELAISSSPVLNSEATYLGRLYVLRDITREREVERLKGEFYALVSHGLRTPLTSIKGYVDLLSQEEETGSLNAIQEEFLGIIQSNTRRLVVLVGDLIDQSQLEAQALLLHTIPLDLHALLRDVIQTLHPQIDERQLHLSQHLADTPAIVLGDENRMGQILTNLLTFIIKHTPVEGQMVVETQLVDKMVRLTCFSTGELSADDLSAFNRPFFYDTTTSAPGEGSSLLGPSIARSLVELHGGSLQMSSGPGIGSVLNCILPRAFTQASKPSLVPTSAR